MNRLIKLLIKTKPYSFLSIIFISVVIHGIVDCYSVHEIEVILAFIAIILFVIFAIRDTLKYKLIQNMIIIFKQWKFRDVFILGVALSIVFCILFGFTQLIIRPHKERHRTLSSF